MAPGHFPAKHGRDVKGVNSHHAQETWEQVQAALVTTHAGSPQKEKPTSLTATLGARTATPQPSAPLGGARELRGGGLCKAVTRSCKRETTSLASVILRNF